MSGQSKGVLTAVALLAVATAAFGQGVGPGGPFETSYVLQPGTTAFDPSPVAWIADAGSIDVPISVELDPAGPAWVKHFVLPTGAHLDPGRGISFGEELVIGGQRPWSGWREDVLTPGFSWRLGPGWAFGAVGGDAPLQDLTVDWAPPGSAPNTGVAFSFASQSPGTHIGTGMVLVYNGTDPFSGTITTLCYPTPEPGMCALLATGSAVVLGGRRSRNTR